MLAAALWLVYAIPAYVLYTIYFRVRYGFSPIAERLPPRSLYGWMDGALFLTVLAYSVWIVLRAPGESVAPVALAVGFVFWGAGAVLRCWALGALGPHWRIGQDETDTRAEFVATGPYRFMHHPINAGLVLVAIGQALMTGIDARAMMLLGVSVLYFLVQGRAEERRWRK